ncbi:hypothetical protein, partial [Desulfofundulus sp.]|uniref:hypothetical protein n=1 Tax=Desulfofundulus sp. TaxID=2282750 RepID=UPI003C748320
SGEHCCRLRCPGSGGKAGRHYCSGTVVTARDSPAWFEQEDNFFHCMGRSVHLEVEKIRKINTCIAEVL